MHVSSIEEAGKLVLSFDEKARALAEEFWPGPLTLVLPKSGAVPERVSAGLPTLAVRFPAHPAALELIRLCAFPLAAPSANISGKPSPTSARHVFEDLNGRIPYIIDGGDCEIGLESTVLSLVGEVPRLLRPGKISTERLTQILGKIEIDKAVLNKIDKQEKVFSPGMKYKHYSPMADVRIFEGDSEDFAAYVNSVRHRKGLYALCFDEEAGKLRVPHICYGKSGDIDENARRLFAALREFDAKGAEEVIAHVPPKDGAGLSVYNRLLRSAGFRFIKSGKYLVGLTGQTGSGKTGLCGYLKKSGFAVINCDKAAHSVISGGECLRKLAAEFGAEILTPEGALDRRRLASIVFADGEKLALLNKITHPPVIKKILELAGQCPEKAVILDAPTLIESGLYKSCDLLVSVLADKEERLKRICLRDGLSAAEAEARVNSQKRDEFYKEKSDIIIYNSGSVDELCAKAAELALRIRREGDFFAGR